MSQLNTLRPFIGSIKKKKRVGRGLGSTIGKRSRRGQKGSKSRAGYKKGTYEGGQTKIYKRLPKRG